MNAHLPCVCGKKNFSSQSSLEEIRRNSILGALIQSLELHGLFKFLKTRYFKRRLWTAPAYLSRAHLGHLHIRRSCLQVQARVIYLTCQLERHGYATFFSD